MPTCTYCKGTKWYAGPEGGMSQNILCANPECRHWFNNTPFFGLDDLKRVEPTEDEKTATRTAEWARSDAIQLGHYNEGIAIYREGKSVRDCVKTTTNSTMPITHADVQRLCGFLDEMDRTIRRRPR